MLLRKSRSGVIIELNPFRVLLARLGRLGGAGCAWKRWWSSPRTISPASAASCTGSSPKTRPPPGICGVFSPTRLFQREEVNVKRLAEPDYLPGLLSAQYKVEAEKWRLVLVNPYDGFPFDEKNPPIKEVLICGESRDEARGTTPVPRSGRAAAANGDILPARPGRPPELPGPGRDGQPAAVIELDLHRTYVFILGKNGVNTPAPIEFGFNQLIETACKELGVEDAAAVRARLLAGEADVVARSPRLLRQLIRNLSRPSITSSCRPASG